MKQLKWRDLFPIFDRFLTEILLWFNFVWKTSRFCNCALHGAQTVWTLENTDSTIYFSCFCFEGIALNVVRTVAGRLAGHFWQKEFPPVSLALTNFPRCQFHLNIKNCSSQSVNTAHTALFDIDNFLHLFFIKKNIGTQNIIYWSRHGPLTNNSLTIFDIGKIIEFCCTME